MIGTLDTDLLPLGIAVPFPDTPNIPSRIAPSLPIPFEEQPIVCSDQVSENKALELMAIEVLEVYRLYYAVRHLSVQLGNSHLQPACLTWPIMYENSILVKRILWSKFHNFPEQSFGLTSSAGNHHIPEPIEDALRRNRAFRRFRCCEWVFL